MSLYLSESEIRRLRIVLQKLDDVEEELHEIAGSIRRSPRSQRTEYEDLEEIGLEIFNNKQELRKFFSKYGPQVEE